MKKIVFILLGLLFLYGTAWSQEDYSEEIIGDADEGPSLLKPKVSFGGLLYTYGFFYQNADFNKATDDGNSYLYIHGDLHANADFGQGVSSYLSIGSWWVHGLSSVYRGDIPDHVGIGEEARLASKIMEGYFLFDKIFDSPLSFKIGKQHMLYGDGAVIFDGGEHGIVGAKLSYVTEYVSADLFYLRNRQNRSLVDVGTALDTLPNENIYGIYPSFRLFGKKLVLTPYVMGRHGGISKDSISTPVWFGARAEFALGKFSARAEYTQMGGKNMYDVSYAGKHMMLGVDYTTPKFNVGAAYVTFSGDDAGSDKNERYESATQGPYTFGFYKSWVGYGPAHVMNSFATFELLNPGLDRGPSNQDMVNVHVAYTGKSFMMRADYFMYSRNQVVGSISKNMGSEIALLAKYTYRETIDVGFTIGSWMSGDYQKEILPDGATDAGSAIGGYLFISKSF